MKSKTHLLISLTAILISVISLFIFFTNKSASNAEENLNITKKLDIVEIKNRKDTSVLRIKYTLPSDNPVIVLNSPQFKNIDITKLKKKIGDKNISIKEDDKKIFINLKNNIDPRGNGEFLLETLNQNKTDLTFTDLKASILTKKVLNDNQSADHTIDSAISSSPETSQSSQSSSTTNQPTSESKNNYDSSDLSKSATFTDTGGDPISDDETDPESQWISSRKLKISPGPAQKLTDGRQVVPVIYFGALNYALENINIHESIGDRPSSESFGDLVSIPGADGQLSINKGEGRKNNITAANTAVIIVPKGGNVFDKQTKTFDGNKNEWLTNTFGDGLLTGGGHVITNFLGSQRNHVTTNLYNLVSPSGTWSQPNLLGVDNKTGKGDHRIALDEGSERFYTRDDPVTKLPQQRITFDQANGRYEKIKISITQGFQADGSIYVHINFKNIGNTRIPHFTGYAFRDITFMRNHSVNTFDKNTVLRSLGQNRGVYASRKDLNGSIRFRLNEFEDSPYAWSARGTSSTFFSTTQTDFPWRHYSSEMSGKNDAWYNIYDHGDKELALPLGKRFVGENGASGWDSGISMHTEGQPLAYGESVSMSYEIEYAAMSSNPMIGINQKGTSNNPYVVDSDSKNINVDGGWAHLGESEISMRYLIDAKNNKDKSEIINHGTLIFNKTQTPSQQKVAERQAWGSKIPIENLRPGKHTISFLATDKNDPPRSSSIRTLVIEIPKNATKEPQIKILSPAIHQENTPFHPANQAMNISGFWSDNDNEYVDITYELDDCGSKKHLFKNAKNDKGETMPWEFDNYSIQDLNDTKIHHLTFEIDDHDPKTENAKDILYFQHVHGDYQIIVPDTIDFGTFHLLLNQKVTAKPKVSGNLIFKDYRPENAPGLDINLTTNNFVQNQRFNQIDNSIDENNPTPSVTLDNQVFWNNQVSETPINGHSSFKIKEQLKPQAGKWQTSIDLTHEFEKGLKMNITMPNGVRQGTFNSTWVWTVKDAI